MNIYEELDIDLDKKELICFVGAGGKTTSMFLLAQELKSLGKKVLVTTTTAIFYPEENEYDEIIIEDNIEINKIEKSINNGSILVIGKEVTNQRKLKGIEKDTITDIFNKGIFDYILVESDGSKRKPIKAPASHEPVLPTLCTKVIGLIGLDSIGKKIDSEFVHRPEIFTKITNSNIGDLITEDIVFNLVSNENGLFKDASIDTKKYLILNKCDNESNKESAIIIKDLIKKSGFKINKIIIASMTNKKKYDDSKNNITAIILASGFSNRMGKQKLLLEIENIPIIERVIKAVKNSKINEIILIYRDDKIKDIGNKYEIKTFYNDNADKGQSEAIKLGVKNSSKESKAYMFFVGDQPYLDSVVINEIIHTFNKENNKIIVPKYNDKNGNPVLFSSILKENLLNLNGDIGGKSIINELKSEVKYMYFENEKMGIDIDTAEEYETYNNKGMI